VGNFDHVFEEHVRHAYEPFLRRVAERDALPVALHVSGPLLDWLVEHPNTYLDLLGKLVADGRIELLLSGYYEPILAALPRADRLEQIAWMREALRTRFGVEARGLWLTERVWEPDLAADLASAGVEYVLVDDRHFLVTGLERSDLHVPYLTESDGRAVSVLSIDERLRYLVPFRPPEETAAYFQELKEAGHPLAVLADDGEKFGGWPGTREWVYERGWLDAFLTMLQELRSEGTVQLVTPRALLAQVPCGGIVYLPTASYREMEAWALPPRAALRLANLEREVGEERLAGPEGALIRGGHWRGFLARYPEANRLHKKMVTLSRLCRDRGNPPDARRAIGRAQCNDAYWHGVFGGLYLPHLRRALWAELARAEGLLRRGESLAWETLDIDFDGRDEIWIHSSSFSAIVSPARGGAIEELTYFTSRVNVVDVLTRRVEAYHEAHGGHPHAAADSGTPSIHDLEEQLRFTERPVVDLDDRALLLERLLAGALTEASYQTGYEPADSWTRASATVEVHRTADALVLVLRSVSPNGRELEKQLRFDSSGQVVASYRWDPAGMPTDVWFSVELSLATPITVVPHPVAEIWSHLITTAAKSERGAEETAQGTAYLFRWPATAGAAQLSIS
jgi:alpha-amylase